MNDNGEYQPKLCLVCQGELIFGEILMYQGEIASVELLDEAVIQARENDPEAEWVQVMYCPQCGSVDEVDGSEVYEEWDD